MPAMVSLIEAIDWSLVVRERLCVPRSVERWLLVRRKEGTESVIWRETIAIISTNVVLLAAIVMSWMSRIHYYPIKVLRFLTEAQMVCALAKLLGFTLAGKVLDLLLGTAGMAGKYNSRDNVTVPEAESAGLAQAGGRSYAENVW